ncbi:MAG: hypothetical protein JXM70_28320, partial [Pirellulales bacterium]|nr:hypothetical protein [Pirellulales bacterium]
FSQFFTFSRDIFQQKSLQDSEYSLFSALRLRFGLVCFSALRLGFGFVYYPANREEYSIITETLG